MYYNYKCILPLLDSSTMVTKFDATVQQRNGRSASCPLDVSTECAHIMVCTYKCTMDEYVIAIL